MKIEILLCENINEQCTGSTCFEAPGYVRKAIRAEKHIRGIVIIDSRPVKFSFSSFGMDGDIFSDELEDRLIVKYLIPLYVYNNRITEVALV